MKPKTQRGLFLLICACMSAGALWLVMRNLDDYVMYFYAPSDLVSAPPAEDENIRVGGMVKAGSVLQQDDYVRFTITDYQHDVVIYYQGALPALFREGQGIVAQGQYRGGVVQATEVLAKHDEYYMPPEIAKTLKDQPDWKSKAEQSLNTP